MDIKLSCGCKCFKCGKELAPNFEDSGIFSWSGFLSIGYPRDRSPYFNDIALCTRCHEEVLDVISEFIETAPSTEAE